MNIDSIDPLIDAITSRLWWLERWRHVQFPSEPCKAVGSLRGDTSMRKACKYWKQATSLVIAMSCITLSSIAADNVQEKRKSPIADQELFSGTVPKAVCGP